MIIIIYYKDFYYQFLIKTCLICKNNPENSESVHKWSVSVIVQKHRLEGTDFTSDIHMIIGRAGSRSVRELKSCSVRPALGQCRLEPVMVPDQPEIFSAQGIWSQVQLV